MPSVSLDEEEKMDRTLNLDAVTVQRTIDFLDRLVRGQLAQISNQPAVSAAAPFGVVHPSTSSEDALTVATLASLLPLPPSEHSGARKEILTSSFKHLAGSSPVAARHLMHSILSERGSRPAFGGDLVRHQMWDLSFVRLLWSQVSQFAYTSEERDPDACCCHRSTAPPLSSNLA